MSPTVQEAFLACENLARSHYENFPIGWFIPRETRKYVYVLYAFARTADDFSDELAFQGARMERLNEYEKLLDQAVEGRADQPIFVALSETFAKTGIPPQLLKDLLTAFRMDVTKKRYKSFAELQDYCIYSANPVGRLVLFLFGHRDPALLALSDKICTGIQLVNHWQDIGIDLTKDRVYLPEEDMKRFNYSYEDLQQKRRDDAFRSLMRFEIARTRSFFFEGKPLLNSLERKLKRQISLMWAGPMKILEKIEKVDYDVFYSRPKLSTFEKLRLFLPL